MPRTRRILIATALATGALAPNALAAGYFPEAVLETSAKPVRCGPGALCVGYQSPAGQQVFFNAAHSEPGSLGGRIVKVEMDLNGNGAYDFTTTNPLQSGKWTFQAPARDLTIKARVTNAAGVKDETSLKLRVNTPPTASLSFPRTVPAHVPVPFDASGSTDDQAGLQHRWDPEGDGTYEDASAATRDLSFPAGTHTVGLKVVDAHGLEATTIRTVVVTAPEPRTPSTARLAGGPAKLVGKQARVALACSAGTTRCAGSLELAAGGVRRYDLAAGTDGTVSVRVGKAARKRIRRTGSLTTLATVAGTSANLTIVR